MRLDVFLVENLGVASRAKAQDLIKNGKVQVDGKIILKPSFEVNQNDVEIAQNDEFVSRGAYKLLGAKHCFGVNFDRKTVLDIGASTGGFTQVCLNFGAKKVYALDVGHGQLDKTLKSCDKVVNLEGVDFRQAKKLDDVNLIVSDISFISLSHILPILSRDYPSTEMVLLFKPQFECGEKLAKKFRGVILDKKTHVKLLLQFIQSIKNCNLRISDLTFSPVCGRSGNIEYLVHINGEKDNIVDVNLIVGHAFEKLKVSKNKNK